MIVAILLVLALALALLAAWVKSRRATGGPYVLLESLLDSDELRLAQLLEQAADGRYRLLCKVRLDSLLAVELAPRSKGWQQATHALQGLTADFLLCDRNFSPLLLVASTPERRLLNLCQQIGLPLLAVDVRRSYKVEELRQQLQRALASAAPDLELDSSPLPPLRATSPQPREATPSVRARDDLEPQLGLQAPRRHTPSVAAALQPVTASGHSRHLPPVADRQEPVFNLGRNASSAAADRRDPVISPITQPRPTSKPKSIAPSHSSTAPALATTPDGGGFDAGQALEQSLADLLTPASSVPASSSDGQAPHCPRCQAAMVRVRPKDGRAAPFWSCSNYPQCRTTLADGSDAPAPSRPADPLAGLPPLRAER